MGENLRTRREVLQGLTTAIAATSAAAPAADALGRSRSAHGARRPNIVFFLGEGVRADEFGITGNPIIRTPNIDRIGREGAIFQNAFATNALCLPSRASFLTGAYSHTTGATTNDEAQVPPQFKMVTDVLREHGYEMAFIGKSHVRGALMDHKWDYYFGFKGQASYLHPTITEGRDGRYEQPKTYNRYVDDVLTDKAVEWIQSRGEKPFCLFLWFYAPHEPFYRPRRLLNLYNGVKIPVPGNFDEDLTDYAGKSRAVAEAHNKIGTTEVNDDNPRTLEEVVKDHYAGVVSNDEDVGRVLDALERKGKLEETAIMLSADHGFFLGEHCFYDKRLMYEPSIRIPMMIRWPGHIPAGTRREEMVLNIDAPVMLLDIAGLPVPATMQGRSFLPLARGESRRDWRKDWLYEYYEYPVAENVRPHRGIRTERYKLIQFIGIPEFSHPEEFELYDLATDPDENHNLYGRTGFEELTARLKSRLEELRRETGDNYAYRPCRTSFLVGQYGPPERPQPWRPNRS
jgi:arylsulfatase A-like enzyme